MASYRAINTKFNPLSFDDFRKPLEYLERRHDALEEAYSKLEAESMTLEARALATGDTRAAKLYKDYAETLRNNIAELASNGLSANSSRALMASRGAYARDIVPIAKGFEKMDADIAAQQQGKQQGFLYETNASSRSIDDYMLGNSANNTIDTKTLLQRSMNAYADLAKRLDGNYGRGTNIDNYTSTFETSRGMTGRDISDFIAKLQSGEADPSNLNEKEVEMYNVFNTLLSSTGIRDWKGFNEGNQDENFAKVVNTILEGATKAIGVDDVKPLELYGDRQALQQQYAKEQLELKHRLGEKEKDSDLERTQKLEAWKRQLQNGMFDSALGIPTKEEEVAPEYDSYYYNVPKDIEEDKIFKGKNGVYKWIYGSTDSEGKKTFTLNHAGKKQYEEEIKSLRDILTNTYSAFNRIMIKEVKKAKGKPNREQAINEAATELEKEFGISKDIMRNIMSAYYDHTVGISLKGDYASDIDREAVHEALAEAFNTMSDKELLKTNIAKKIIQQEDLRMPNNGDTAVKFGTILKWLADNDLLQLDLHTKTKLNEGEQAAFDIAYRRSMATSEERKHDVTRNTIAFITIADSNDKEAMLNVINNHLDSSGNYRNYEIDPQTMTFKEGDKVAAHKIKNINGMQLKYNVDLGAYYEATIAGEEKHLIIPVDGASGGVSNTNAAFVKEAVNMRRNYEQSIKELLIQGKTPKQVEAIKAGIKSTIAQILSQYGLAYLNQYIASLPEEEQAIAKAMRYQFDDDSVFNREVIKGTNAVLNTALGTLKKAAVKPVQKESTQTNYS